MSSRPDGLEPAIARELARPLRQMLVLAAVATSAASYLTTFLSPARSPVTSGATPSEALAVLIGEAATFAVLMAITAVAAWHVLRGRKLGAARWPLAGLAIVAPIVGRVHSQLVDPHHWTFGVVGGVIVMLLIDASAGTVVAVLMLHHGVATFGQVALSGQAASDDLVALAIMTVMAVAFNATSWLSLRLVVRTAAAAAATAAEEEALHTAEQVAEQLWRDRRARGSKIMETVAPLLVGLADGDLDLGDAATRRECAAAAARLRRMFAENDDVPDPLVHELRACIDVAQRSGVVVDLAVRGVLPVPPAEVRRAFAEHALALLTAAGTKARVAVVGGADGQVSVSVVADVSTDVPLAGTGVRRTGAAGRVPATILTHDGWTWLEATWMEATWTERTCAEAACAEAAWSLSGRSALS